MFAFLGGRFLWEERGKMRGTQYLHPYMKQKADELVVECAKKGLKIKITDTWRTKEEQNSISSQFSKVKYPSSYHCWGIAFDICRNDGKGAYYDNDGFFAKVGKIANSIGLGWGGNLWTDFIDKPHFQISKFGTPKQLIQKYGNPDNFKKTWETFKEEYTVENTRISVDGKVIEVKAINYKNQNYINLRDLEKAGITISYDSVKKIPVVSTK